MPAVFAFIQLTLVLFVFKFDTPKFYLQNNQIEEYKEITSRIYLDQSEESNLISHESKQNFFELQKTSNNNTPNQRSRDSSSFGDRKVLLIGICLSALHQFAGINCVIFNSNQIFVEGVSGLAAEKAARVGSLFIGIASILGPGFTVYISKKLH